MSNKKSKETEEKTISARVEIYEWIQSIIIAVIICVVIFTFFVRLIDVNGPSMNPTLEHGDKMVVSNLFYEPKAGDIVIFRKDEYKHEALVKRVIATEGQTVEIDPNKGVVKVDGVVLDEPYIAAPTSTMLDFSGKMTVPEGCVFVMGDNRNNSTDSRKAEIGMVDERCIIGKVYFVIFPLDRIGSPYGD